MKKHLFGISLILLCTGCADKESAELPEHIRDLENLTVYPADAEPAYNIELVRDQIFGDTDSFFFQRLGRVAVAGSGRVFIIDAVNFNEKLHAFNSDGSYLGVVGRQGDGPGEYRSPTNLQVLADMISVYDFSLRRVNVYSVDDLEFSHSFLPDEHALSADQELNGTRISNIYLMNNGHYLLEYSGLKATSDDVTTSDNSVTENVKKYLVVNHLGEPVSNEILELRSAKIFFNRNDSLFVFSSLRFLGDTLTGLSDDGLIISAWSQDFLFKSYSMTEGYQSAFYYPFQKKAFDKDSYFDANVSRMAMRDAMEGEVEFPATWPALETMLVDDENRIWAATIVEDEEIYELWVLENSGELIAKFLWPRDEPIEVVKNGSLYSRETDEETGIESIVRYRIELAD